MAAAGSFFTWLPERQGCENTDKYPNRFPGSPVKSGPSDINFEVQH
jgi:hypothetical protein